MTIEQVEKIEQFLSGEMSPEEEQQFQQDLLTDQELLAAYTTYRAVQRDMVNPQQYVREEDVKSTLAELGNEFIRTSKTTKGSPGNDGQPLTAGSPGNITTHTHSRIKWMQPSKWAAAAILVIVVTGSWYLITESSRKEKMATNSAVLPGTAGSGRSGQDTLLQTPALPDSAKPEIGKIRDVKNRRPEQVNSVQQLFATYFKPDTVPAEKAALLKTAFGLYESRQYTRAADLFEDAGLELSTRGTETDEPVIRFYATYYQALSYMAGGQAGKAIPLLQKVSNPGPYQVKVDWYLALCYVRSTQVREAIPLLRKIRESGQAGQYGPAAGELVAELEKQRPK